MTVTVATLADRVLDRLGVVAIPVGERPAMTETVPFATIATMALVELGVIASDETPIPSDQALALDKVASVNAALIAQGSVWWSGNVVPRAFVEEYTKLTAAQMASAFGKAVDPASVKLFEARVTNGANVYKAPAAAHEAVMAVHTELAAADKVRWSSFDIPPSAEQPYVVKAANRIAMNFDSGAVDPRAEVQADIVLARVIALPTSGEVTPAVYF